MPEAQLRAAFDDFFAKLLAESPEVTTALGLDKGDHADAKSKLSKGTQADVERRKGETARQLARLRGIDRKALTGMAAVNYDSVLYDLDTTDRVNKRFNYGSEGGGSPYVLSQITGAWQAVPDFLDSQHTIETKADCEAYVARLAEFARQIDEDTAAAGRDVAKGVIPPDFCIAGALSGMKTLHAPTDKSSLVTSVRDRAKAKEIPGSWGDQAGSVYEKLILPALDRQIAFLEGLKGKATHDAGVWKLPDGEAYYAYALQARTTTTMTPAEVHKIGLDVTAELQARADVLFRKLGMTQGSVAQRYGALFKDPKYLYPNTDAGKAREVADLNALVQGMQKRLPQYFGTLPKAGLEIRRIPPATEAGASTHYTTGSLDGTRP
ncbi:MAG TPA: DUF885 family protein, partial [Phenylobacterium sp.]|nr:DUF885 family protein [Phenylobacterium sp.]